MVQRVPYDIRQLNCCRKTAAGSVSSNMTVIRIFDGKPKLSGLPATYTESKGEAQTLRIFLKDALTGAKLALLYTIFDEYSAIARSAYIENAGEKNLHVLNMMSLSLDLPDKDYESMFSCPVHGPESAILKIEH